jgi:hypothetical protein
LNSARPKVPLNIYRVLATDERQVSEGVLKTVAG